MDRGWQFLFSLGFVALFFFLFVVKPAPEETFRASVPINATPEDVASVLETGRTFHDLRRAAWGCPRATRKGLACLAQATDDWLSLLLAKGEKINVSLEPQGSSVLLTAESRWQVRGGLLGKALDRVVARRFREKALAAALLDLKAKAEGRRAKQV